MMCAFIAQQVLETWTALGSDVRAVYMHVAREAVTIVLFAVSSWVAMNGAYFQFNLLLGLGKTLDCWCGDMLETQNFIGGISSWNSLQAMLKCVGREVTWCFTVLISLGYIGLFISLAASLSLFLEPDLDIGSVLLSESALLPLMYLFFLSARLVAQGALLSEKCRQIPAFVNQLLGDRVDLHRQYLVHFIADSSAGFIVHGVTLSQAVFLRQMHFLTAVFSGFGGLLARRYL
ncbi:Uncharacterized protein SCF082_LOCUS28918 [Durusdinium trenchii]|eukprot:g18630.t1